MASGKEFEFKEFYKKFSGKGGEPLEPDDPYYVPILQKDPQRDPILKLWKRIDWAESESVDLLTGFRGNGKSTELKRLKKLLEESGCHVIHIDMVKSILMTKPLEISDFILSLMAALAQELEEKKGLKTITHTYWERLAKFLQSEVGIKDLNLSLKTGEGAAKLGLQLKSEPTFKEKIQVALRGHVTTLVEEARSYVVDLVEAIRKKANDEDKKIVLLVDSMEQIRGVGTEAPEVYKSMVNLFSGQAANLSFRQLHIVYTVPPFLIPLAPHTSRTLGGHPITSWPNIHVRNKKDGKTDPEGLETMVSIIGKRYKSWDKIFSRAHLCRLGQASGGDLRDFFRLIRECLIAKSNTYSEGEDLFVTDSILDQVEGQLKSEFLPLALEDRDWLARIHKTKEAELPSDEELPRLAKFLDSNLIMNYLNGEPWYDIHPLLVEELKKHKKKD